MSATTRTTIKLLLDMFLMNAATLLACALKFEGQSLAEYRQLFMYYAALLTLFRVLALCIAGVYRSLWRYASIEHMLAVVAGITVGSAAFYITLSATGSGYYPLAVLIIDWLVCIALLGGIRAAFRVMLKPRANRSSSPKRVLVVGAGDAGAAVVAEIKRQRNGYYPIGFVDDDREKIGRIVQGIPVIGASADIPRVVAECGIDEIVVACPSASAQRLSEIVSLAHGTPARVRALPTLHEILSGEARLQDPERIRAEDLLERREVGIELEKIGECIAGKRVLVSGAGGSIGSELCRQIAMFNPKQLYLLDQNENGIFEVEQELKAQQRVSCIPIVADIKDLRRLSKVFETHQPEVVFHAAAHKHVPLMELYPEEAVKTNIFGTRNIARCAMENGCSKFVLISTDKAVSPSSVMGASKRAAEMIVQGLASEGKTDFVTVRFGNVLDSRGSLLPNLKRQIAKGGPVTITHPAMERYFMTIPEAVRLVLLVAALGENGQLMLLDMGQPVNILKLADKLIRLCGKVPGLDIGIHFTGVRPGEKLSETLLTDAEGAATQRVGQFFVVSPGEVDFPQFQECLGRLEKRLSRLEPGEARLFLRGLVPGYNPVLPSAPSAPEMETRAFPSTFPAVPESESMHGVVPVPRAV